MEKIIWDIFQTTLREELQSVDEIVGLGCVNRVFETRGKNGSYIIRLNEESEKLVEYKKEAWCIQAVDDLGIPTTRVIKVGKFDEYPFIIESKVPGVNGRQCPEGKQARIWKKLGEYAARFQHLNREGEDDVQHNLFHRDWKTRLNYNLKELNEEDRLLKNGVFNREEHRKAKAILTELGKNDFKSGLVHGDLRPGNVVVDGEKIFLLDWGTAEINIVPHTEIGTRLLCQDTTQEAFQWFLKGLGIAPQNYIRIEEEIHQLNFLHRLDKYRWAEGRNLDNIAEYEDMVRATFAKIIG